MVNPGTEVSGFCASTANIWQIVGIVLMVVKIVIPILLIIWGMLDLGKAVVAAKDDEIKKATKSLAMRAISAIIIFFIPTLVNVILSMVSNFSTVKDDWNVCRSCISNPNDSACEMYADSAWSGDF